MAIAACLTLAVIHVQIAFKLRGRMRASHLFFTLAAVGVAATGSFELSLLQAQSLGMYQHLMRWAQIPLFIMVVSLTGFAWHLFERGNRCLAIAAVVLMTLCTVANFLVPPELSIRHATAIHTATSFGGVSFTLPTLRNGPLTACEVAAVVCLSAFVAHSAILTWQKGDRRRAVLIGGGIIFFQLVSRSYALLVETGAVQSPFYFIVPFLALLLAMGRELSMDVFRAAQLSEQLRESEHRMELAARAATMGFWIWYLKRDELWATESARTLFGVPNDEYLDFARFAATLHPDDLEHVRKAIDDSIRNGTDYEAEYRILPGGNQRWIIARGRLEKDHDGTPALMRGVVMDVTEQKKAQFEADELRRELAHVTRVSTMGELAASMAHELNQPLAAILSNAQAARRFLASPEVNLDEIRDILDDIVKDDKRAGEVIHRLRALVQKKERVAPEPVNLHELAQDAERLLNSELISRNVELVLEPVEPLPLALAGRVEIQQVLLNLVVNAMDALRDQPPEQRRITIAITCRDGLVCTAVRDTGTGIPDKVMHDIFRPFFTTKQHGLGMGLAICRSMIESFGGRMWAQNHPDGGALFQFELPSLPTLAPP